jgi:hypothetical protein
MIPLDTNGDGWYDTMSVDANWDGIADQYMDLGTDPAILDASNYLADTIPTAAGSQAWTDAMVSTNDYAQDATSAGAAAFDSYIRY